jgi:hypothetical protein
MCQKAQLERLHAVRETVVKQQIALSSDHGGQLGARRLLCMDKIQVCYHLQDALVKQQCTFNSMTAMFRMLVMHKAHDALHHMRDFTVACES